MTDVRIDAFTPTCKGIAGGVDAIGQNFIQPRLLWNDEAASIVSDRGEKLSLVEIRNSDGQWNRVHIVLICFLVALHMFKRCRAEEDAILQLQFAIFKFLPLQETKRCIEENVYKLFGKFMFRNNMYGKIDSTTYSAVVIVPYMQLPLQTIE